jgi:hypothetical protein
MEQSAPVAAPPVQTRSNVVPSGPYRVVAQASPPRVPVGRGGGWPPAPAPYHPAALLDEQSPRRRARRLPEGHSAVESCRPRVPPAPGFAGGSGPPLARRPPALPQHTWTSPCPPQPLQTAHTCTPPTVLPPPAVASAANSSWPSPKAPVHYDISLEDLQDKFREDRSVGTLLELQVKIQQQTREYFEQRRQIANGWHNEFAESFLSEREAEEHVRAAIKARRADAGSPASSKEGPCAHARSPVARSPPPAPKSADGPILTQAEDMPPALAQQMQQQPSLTATEAATQPQEPMARRLALELRLAEELRTQVRGVA